MVFPPSSHSRSHLPTNPPATLGLSLFSTQTGKYEKQRNQKETNNK